jgi:hypothetical protein
MVNDLSMTTTSKNQRGHEKWVFFALLSLPALASVIFGIGSAAPGLLFACSLLFAVGGLPNSFRLRQQRELLALFLFMLSGAFVGILNFGFDNIGKSIGSSILLTFCCYVISAVLTHLRRAIRNNRKFSTGTIFLTFVIFGICGLAGFLNFGNYATFDYPVFPFAEPSHYAIAMLTCAVVYLTTNPTRNCWLLTCLVTTALALSFPNTTLAVAAMMLWAIGLPPLFFALATGLLAVGVFLFGNVEIFQYFVDRVSLTEETTNTSALVYMQGLEAIGYVWDKKMILGLGFQALGSEPAGIVADAIFSFNGEYKNRADGGFLLAKLLGEFGLLGAIVAFVFTAFALASYIKLNKHFRSGTSPLLRRVESRDLLLLYGLSYTILLELYVRSFGYFSATLILAILANFSLLARYRRRRISFTASLQNNSPSTQLAGTT